MAHSILGDFSTVQAACLDFRVFPSSECPAELLPNLAPQAQKSTTPTPDIQDLVLPL